ncbi:hypothetical protein GCK32_009806, partial [Trichostrongylus colubriformis]
MTFVIVLAFICCWTPYAIMMFLHFLTKTDWIPKDVRKFIYAFAVFNSAISPYLYGYFSFDLKKELQLLLTCSRSTASDRDLSCSVNNLRNTSKKRLRKRSASATNLDANSSPKLLSPVINVRAHSLRTPRKQLEFRIPKDVRMFIYAFAVCSSTISPYLCGYLLFDLKTQSILPLNCSRTSASDKDLSCSLNNPA